MRQTTIAIMILACTWLTATECQLPCNSSLRHFASLSHLFTHCTCGPIESQTDPNCVCTRSNWTEWTATNVMNISTEVCPSGKEILEERRQRVLTGFTISGCRDIIGHRRICEFITNCRVHHFHTPGGCTRLYSSYNNIPVAERNRPIASVKTTHGHRFIVP